MKEKKQKEYERTPGTRAFRFSANKRLSDIIIGLSKERYRSMSSIIRMLLWLGWEQYQLNEKSGYTTGTKRQQGAAVKMAQAEAAAAQRKRGKDTSTEAVTPLLYGMDEPTPKD